MTQEFTIPGRYDRIIEVCKFVIAGAETVGFNEDALFKIELACDEACTNVIEHAYRGENMGEIRVSWHFTDGKFTIVIDDDAMPFDPNEVPEPNVPGGNGDLDTLRIGGLGIHFMRNLMDEIRFFSNEKRGNRLVMIKNLANQTGP